MAKNNKSKNILTSKVDNRLAYGVIVLLVVVSFSMITVSLSGLYNEMSRLVSIETKTLK